jgi:RNA recognition motif-containing protein
MESAGIKVYVGNCEGISEGELRDEFSRYGHLENVSEPNALSLRIHGLCIAKHEN